MTTVCAKQSQGRGKTGLPIARRTCAVFRRTSVRLADGKLVNVYGRRVNKSLIRRLPRSLTTTQDMGPDNEIMLRHCHNGDLGYPSSCVLPRASTHSLLHPEKQGEKPCLMACESY